MPKQFRPIRMGRDEIGRLYSLVIECPAVATDNPQPLSVRREWCYGRKRSTYLGKAMLCDSGYWIAIDRDRRPLWCEAVPSSADAAKHLDAFYD